MKNKYLFSLSVAWLLLSVFLLTDGVSDPKSFTALDHANVRDCPDDLDQHAASRVVMQYIDGLFYKWEEYDLNDNGTYCIYMQKPERRMLSTDEAKALLEDSAGWIEALPPENKLKTLDPMDPSLQGVPVEAPASIDLPIQNGKLSTGQDQPASRGYPAKVLSPNSFPLQGDRTAPGDNDTRERVTETTSHPWNTVGFIRITFTSDGNTGRGSGFIVTPYVVLTAGHIVYNRERAEFVGAVDFVPGQHQASEGEAVTQPYASYAADSWETNSTYIDPDTPNRDRHMYDYAAVFFNASFTDVGISTFMPIVFDYSPNIDETVQVAGYPTEVQEETNTLSMWYSYGPLTLMDEHTITHRAYSSEGNSGGPVWQSFTSGQRRLIAINVAGSDDEQGRIGVGCRLAQHNQDLIEDWMTWIPSEEPLTAADTGDGGSGGGCFMTTMAE